MSKFDLDVAWLYEPTTFLHSLADARIGTCTVNHDGSYTISNISVPPIGFMGVSGRIEYCKLIYAIANGIAIVSKLGDFLVGIDSPTAVRLECNGIFIGDYNNQTDVRIPLTTFGDIRIIGVGENGIKLRYSSCKDRELAIKPCTFIDSQGKTFLYKEGSFSPAYFDRTIIS